MRWVLGTWVPAVAGATGVWATGVAGVTGPRSASPAQRTVFPARAAIASPALQPAPAARPSLAEPALSPDGREIAFVSGGDIWTVPAVGGAARLLVAHPATESRPLYSPDGRRLAFVSTRTGGGDVYVLDLAGGAVTRLTYDDAPEALDGWSADGRTLYFMSDRGGAENLWARPVDSGRPAGAARRLTAFADGRVLWPSIGRDGRTIVFERDFGIWRADAATGQASPVPVTLVGAPAGPAVERLTLTGGFQELAVSPDGRTLLLVAQAAGQTNLWTWPLDELTREAPVARQLTSTGTPKADAQWAPTRAMSTSATAAASPP